MDTKTKYKLIQDYIKKNGFTNYSTISRALSIDRRTIKQAIERNYEFKNNSNYTSTDDEFKQAVKTSRSIREAIGKLGLIPAGGAYSAFHRRVKKLGLDTSHFTGKSWSKGACFGPKIQLSEILVKDRPYQSHKLRLRLISEGLKQYKCENCNRTEWEGKEIPLELEHINGDHNDNRLENLKILCPNCHALTPTYRGKNKKRRATNLAH